MMDIMVINNDDKNWLYLIQDDKRTLHQIIIIIIDFILYFHVVIKFD